MKTTLSKEVVPVVLSDSAKAEKIASLKGGWQQAKKGLLLFKIIAISLFILTIPVIVCFLYIGTSNPCPSWGGSFLIATGTLSIAYLIGAVAFELQKKQKKANKESQLSKKNLPKLISNLAYKLIKISLIVLSFYLGFLGTPLPEWGNVFLISYASLEIIGLIALVSYYFHINNVVKNALKIATKKYNIPMTLITT